MGFQRFYLIAGAFFCVKLVGEGYAVSFRLGAPGDAGMVPLRGSQIPGSRRSQAEAHRCGMADRSEVWQRGGSLSLVYAMPEKGSENTCIIEKIRL